MIYKYGLFIQVGDNNYCLDKSDNQQALIIESHRQYLTNPLVQVLKAEANVSDHEIDIYVGEFDDEDQNEFKDVSESETEYEEHA